ncbi:hypothetical protein B5566_02370 [Mycobacterium sp. MHSD3]|nr:hypothetical protein B5566_02370 [Mycobacterium sp. MHSD3]
MTPVEWVPVGVVAGVALTALYSRRPSYKDIVDRLAKVESRVDSLESDLTKERLDHARTWDKLLVAWRYIRDVVAWRQGPRLIDLPEPPPEVVRDIA